MWSRTAALDVVINNRQSRSLPIACPSATDPIAIFCRHAGMGNAVGTIVRAEGVMALYRGLAPTLVGIAPYAALNFALYDLVKVYYYGGGKPQGTLSNLGIGAMTGTIAATVCYPLDTVRRRMQMPGNNYNNQLHALQTIWAKVRDVASILLLHSWDDVHVVHERLVCWTFDTLAMTCILVNVGLHSCMHTQLSAWCCSMHAVDTQTAVFWFLAQC